MATDLRETNRALVEEVRAICQYVDTVRLQQERMKRRAWLAVLVLGVVVLLPVVALLGLALSAPPPGVDVWEQQWQRQQWQLDRTDEALDRADKLAGRVDNLVERWEKAAPKP